LALRRGVELIRHRGDLPQAQLLERWLVDLLHDLTVVTRNTEDFAGCGVRLLNPFQAP
jgi:hypothetical protein